MDSYYPTESAAKALVNWNNKLGRTDGYLIQKGMAWPTANLDLSVVTIKKMDHGQSTKAMFPSTDSHRQEAVFTVVGVLNQHTLPPVHGVKFSSQHTTVVGFDNEYFQKASENLEEVAWAIGTGPVQKRAHQQLSLLHHWRQHPAGLKTPFHPKTDPRGVLTAHLSDKVSHCLDNDVMYMVLKDNKYIEKDPATFKSRDIVEMGFAFVVWRKGKHSIGPEYGCKLVLRTLMFIDGKYTKTDKQLLQEAFFAKNTALARARPYQNCDMTVADMNPVAKRKLKEQIDSDDKEETSTAKRMHLLNISAPSPPSATDHSE
ncbi:hypothetical protein B0H14DRAFT_2607494 [Mycena olivaceomarginata]|nr:hypothetical protein B0H14DRAFT_2607494 [Mycena olivaceomarginata]